MAFYIAPADPTVDLTMQRHLDMKRHVENCYILTV